MEKHFERNRIEASIRKGLGSDTSTRIIARLELFARRRRPGGVRISDLTEGAIEPWVVRFARKLAAKNPDLVVAKGQKTCQVLLVLNLLAVLGEWTLNILFFL